MQGIVITMSRVRIEMVRNLVGAVSQDMGCVDECVLGNPYVSPVTVAGPSSHGLN